MAVDGAFPGTVPPPAGILPPAPPGANPAPSEPAVTPAPLLYPDSDGKPMSDNTRQARWMVTIHGNLAALFRHRPDVFVAINLLWYAEEGNPHARAAPDVLVAFGRPRGDRGSYKQWLEGGIAPAVVFEVLSPGNDVWEMADKLAFYDEHAVQEYYLLDPDANRLAVYQRGAETLRRLRPEGSFTSPLLGIRFDLSTPELVIYRPDGQPFLSFEELHDRAQKAESRAQAASHLAARLAELGRKARRGQASPEDIQELERLEEQSLSSETPPTP